MSRPLSSPGVDVYGAMKHAISAAAYAPGDHLAEARISRELGVSRTPVREAIRRLEAEGWLEVLPNRGARVKQWSTRDVEEIFEARALIEPFLAGQAARRIGDAELTELQALAEAMRDIAAAGAPEDVTEAWHSANKRFHETITAAAGNTRLAASLNALKEMPLVKWTFISYDPQDRERSVRHHFELVQALRARDPQWAESLMRCHILAAQASVLDKADTPTGDIS